MTNSIIPLRKCTKCGTEYPATIEYFSPNRGYKYGLNSRCRGCRSSYNREHNRKHPEKSANRKKRYNQRHHERLLEESRNQYRLHREKKRIWRQQNAEKRAAYGRQYHQQNKHIYALQSARRRALKRSLPNNFYVEDWQRCLDYFHCVCAVCGSQLRDLFGKVEPHIDHWIPLSHPDCPGTTPDNMVCLCSFCNLSKHNRIPREWLIQRYGKRKAAAILKRIETYFDWTKQQS